MYRELNPEEVIKTIGKLEQRIADRFPDSGLRKVCQELLAVAEESNEKIQWIKQPILVLRVGIAAFILLVMIGIMMSVYALPVHWGNFTGGELLQILEATTNELVLIGAALFFLFTLEARVKRSRALKVLFVLRSIAHVIDMHQLTKDPNRNPQQDTEHSPKVGLTKFELMRYLDYCSEMLALVGKIAALYAQVNRDEVVLNTINDVESLSSDLIQQLWQKITILHTENEETEREERGEKRVVVGNGGEKEKAG